MNALNQGLNPPLGRWAAIPLGTVVLMIAACASTSTPPSVLLTLPPAASARAAPPATLSGARQVLALSRLSIPEYLSSRRVRYRAEASTLAEWPDTYWAERIEIGVSREFAAALRERLPAWRLCETNCVEQSPALSLQVDLVRLDYRRAERSLVADVEVALWRGGRAPQLLRSVHQAYTVAGSADTPQAQAEAVTELLGRLAADVSILIDATP